MTSNTDEKNPHSLICIQCQSIVLRNGHGDNVKKSIELPTVSVSKADPQPTYEQFDEWWFVQDVMTFENVGVTNAKDGKRYLCCADCEHGPIGVQADNGYFLAHKRVNSKDK